MGITNPFDGFGGRSSNAADAGTHENPATKVLLAVIHGYGTNDWRDPEATQTFLLKNVGGSDLHVQSRQEFVKVSSGRKLPRPQGDLIADTVQGTPGYLYYATATYSWYDPKTFKGQTQPQSGMFHKPRVLRAHAQAQKAAEVSFTTAEELKAKMAVNQPLTIVDVRGCEGYAASNTTIKGAFHFKLRRLKSRIAYAPLKDVPVLQGGWNEWLKASGPVQPK